MSYDYNDTSRISNEIAAQAEFTRRQNENITYEERIFQLDMAMAKEKDPNVLNELNNLRTQVIDEYEDILKERKRQKIVNTIVAILLLIGLSIIPILTIVNSTKNGHKTTTPSTITSTTQSNTTQTSADPDVIPKAFQGTYRGLDANGMMVEETFYPDGNYVITYDDNPTLNRSGSLTSLVQVSPTVYQLKALIMNDLAKVLPGGQYGGAMLQPERFCWLLKDNQNGTITLEYHQTAKTNGQVDLTDTPNMQATLTKVN